MELPLPSPRNDYHAGTLDADTVSPDPIRQFETWLLEAYAAGLKEPNAMALATATADGEPSCRIVLLRGVSQQGFAFHTNYESRKGRELTANARASLLLFWAELERQVRIEGPVHRLTSEQSDAYFATRPRGSQLGAWASPQSEVIKDRAALNQRLSEMTARFPGAVERPPYWGGFRVFPHTIEFWQQRADRLHDRLRYVREADAGWRIERLAP